MHHPPSTLLPFILNWVSAEDSAGRIEQAGPVPPETLPEFSRMLYLPVTQSALDDKALARAVADLLLQRYFDPTTLLILRLPADSHGGPSLITGIETLLAALRQTGALLPRASAPNILLTIQDLEEDHPVFQRLPYHVVLPETFDFWRHTRTFYALASEVTVLASTRSCGIWNTDVSGIFGARAVRRWVFDPMGED